MLSHLKQHMWYWNFIPDQQTKENDKNDILHTKKGNEVNCSNVECTSSNNTLGYILYRNAIRPVNSTNIALFG